MSLKKVFLFIAVIFSFVLYAGYGIAHEKISDPLKIPLNITPSIINSDSEGESTIHNLYPGVPFLVTCSVQTYRSNDPVYVIFNFISDYGSIYIDVDGVAGKKYNEALIPTPGNHIISFKMSIRAPIGPDDNLTFHNASDDIIDFTSCFASIQ